MRNLFLVICAVLLVAAAPVDDAQKLMEQGRESEAYQLIDKAAATGDADAIDYLAWFYDVGRYVGQDLARAASLYRRAAEAGNRHAQWRLGVMLDQSEGVAENPVEAVHWIKKAADQGSARAYASLAVMYATGRGVRQDFLEARRLYMEAARRGEPHGYFGVAVLHRLGQGVPADPIESLAWMLVAATLEDKEAQEKVTKYGLSSADTRRAAQRANEILAQLGYGKAKVIFRDIDAERAAVPLPK